MAKSTKETQSVLEVLTSVMEKLDSIERKLNTIVRTEKRNNKSASGVKKAMSGYLIYSNEVRPKLKEQHPGAKMPEISKLIGAAWKELDQSEKRKYNDRSAKLKAEGQSQEAQVESASAPVVEAKEESKPAVKKAVVKKDKKVPAPVTEKKPVVAKKVKKQPAFSAEEEA